MLCVSEDIFVYAKYFNFFHPNCTVSISCGMCFLAVEYRRYHMKLFWDLREFNMFRCVATCVIKAFSVHCSEEQSEAVQNIYSCSMTLMTAL